MMAIKAAIDAKGEGETRSVGAGAGFGARHQSGDRGADRLHRRSRCRRATTARSHVEDVKAAARPDVAAIMLTNPNTCGLFERAGRRDRRGRARGRRLLLLPTAPTSTPSSARCGRATSASTPCTSTCTRPSRRRTAAAGRAPGRWCCPQRWRRSRRCRSSSLRRRAQSSELAPPARPMHPYPSRGGEVADGTPTRRHSAVRPHHAPSTARWACIVRALAYMLSHGVGRHAAGLRGRGAQRQLRPRRPRRPDVAALRRPALHARGAVRRCAG